MSTQTQIQNTKARGKKQATKVNEVETTKGTEIVNEVETTETKEQKNISEVNEELIKMSAEQYTKIYKKVDYLVTKVHANNKVSIYKNLDLIEGIFKQSKNEFEALNFSIRFDILREGRNVFLLLGNFTKLEALKYSVNDKIDFTTTKNLVLRWQKMLDIQSIETRKIVETKANKLSELRRDRESSQLDYTIESINLFGGELGDKAIEFLYKENIVLLCEMYPTHFDKESLEVFANKKIETFKFEQTISLAQTQFLLHFCDMEHAHNYSKLGIKNTKGASKVRDILNGEMPETVNGEIIDVINA